MRNRAGLSGGIALLRLAAVLALALEVALSIGHLAMSTGAVSGEPSMTVRVAVAWGALSLVVSCVLALLLRRRPSARGWNGAACALVAVSYGLLLVGEPAALPGLYRAGVPYALEVLRASGWVPMLRPLLELGALAAVTASILAEVPRGRRHGDSWRVYSARRPPRRRPRWKSAPVGPDTGPRTTGVPSSTRGR